MRGWTLDVLNLLRSFILSRSGEGRTNFSLSDAYSLEPHLVSLHPSNRHIRPKIRQQLQVLRDLGLLHFIGDGNYRLT